MVAEDGHQIVIKRNKPFIASELGVVANPCRGELEGLLQ